MTRKMIALVSLGAHESGIPLRPKWIATSEGRIKSDMRVSITLARKMQMRPHPLPARWWQWGQSAEEDAVEI